MKFPLSWLKDHLDTDADAAAIADKLTSIGLEVESVEDTGARAEGFHRRLRDFGGETSQCRQAEAVHG